MKTSIFDMTFTLPPMVEMTEVVKEMPIAASNWCLHCTAYCGTRQCHAGNC